MTRAGKGCGRLARARPTRRFETPPSRLGVPVVDRWAAAALQRRQRTLESVKRLVQTARSASSSSRRMHDPSETGGARRVVEASTARILCDELSPEYRPWRTSDVHADRVDPLAAAPGAAGEMLARRRARSLKSTQREDEGNPLCLEARQGAHRDAISRARARVCRRGR